jgi:hypothetical protein
VKKTLADGSVLEGTPEELAAYERKPEAPGAAAPAPPSPPPASKMPQTMEEWYRRLQGDSQVRQRKLWLDQWQQQRWPHNPLCDACKGGPWFGIIPPQHTCGRPNVSRSWETTCVGLGETPP